MRNVTAGLILLAGAASAEPPSDSKQYTDGHSKQKRIESLHRDEELKRELVAPRKFLDNAYMAGEYPGVGRERSSLFGAFGRAAAANMDSVFNHWLSVVGPESDQVSADEQKSIVQERAIPHELGMTRRRLEGLIAEYDYAQYEHNFTSTIGVEVARLLGIMVGSAFDPVTIMTTPIGGAAFRAAAKAESLREFEIRSEKHRRQK